MPLKQLEELKQVVTKADELIATAGRTNPNGHTRTPTREQVFGAPHVSRGEDPMSSRGYEFQRAIGLMTKTIEPEQAKVEIGVHERMRQALVVGGGFNTAQGTQLLGPLGTDLLDDKSIDRSFRREMKALVLAGTENADPDEIRWLQQRVYHAPGRKVATPQSWLDQSLGGALVEPEGFGELIQLVRNKEALINAGARVVPLPPSGRLRYPRQTAATQGYLLGENSDITQTNFKTGSIVLTGKKACALVVLPGELIRFASPASEAITRADMTKTLSLTLDFGLLQGGGGDNVPLGLLSTPNIATVTPTAANTLSPQDVYKFMAAIESNNGEMEGWIMHPQLFWALVEARASVYNGTTTVPQGQFVYNQFRALEEGFEKRLNGYKVTTTNQVSTNLGNGSQTYLMGGQWSDFVIAMFGAIEFMQSDQGLTLMQNDRVAVRAILTADGAARHPGFFAVANDLNLTLGA